MSFYNAFDEWYDLLKSCCPFIECSHWVIRWMSHLYVGSMKSCFDEKQLWWKSASMKICFDEKPYLCLFWLIGSLLIGVHLFLDIKRRSSWEMSVQVNIISLGPEQWSVLFFPSFIEPGIFNKLVSVHVS